MSLTASLSGWWTRRRRTVLAVTTLAVAGGACVAAVPAAQRLRGHPYFVIERVAIDGAGPALAPEEVREWMALSPTTTLWEARPAALRARLEAHPFIARAEVRRTFPDRLEVRVRERTPVAIAVLDDLYYVDRGGTLFGPLRPADSRNLPFITGLDPDAPAGTRRWLVRRALRLMRRCERADGGPVLGSLSEIHVDADGGATVFPAAPRVPVVLGWGSWPAKLERAARVLREWDDNAERLARLDLRFRNQVVATLRAAPPAAAAAPAPAAPRPRARGGGRGVKA